MRYYIRKGEVETECTRNDMLETLDAAGVRERDFLVMLLALNAKSTGSDYYQTGGLHFIVRTDEPVEYPRCPSCRKSMTNLSKFAGTKPNYICDRCEWHYYDGGTFNKAQWDKMQEDAR
jgi:hypothetical protein